MSLCNLVESGLGLFCTSLSFFVHWGGSVSKVSGQILQLKEVSENQSQES